MRRTALPRPHRAPFRRRTAALLTALALPLAGVLALTASSGSAAAAVPSAPAGWTTAFSDDFTGAAGTGLNTANWLYDTGTSYAGGAGNWGTGEVETATNSTTNVYQDGSGHLIIKPVRDASGNWTGLMIRCPEPSW